MEDTVVVGFYVAVRFSGKIHWRGRSSIDRSSGSFTPRLYNAYGFTSDGWLLG